MPDEVKLKLMWKHHNSENKNIFRGLAPFVDNDESHKELFDMGVPYEQISVEERKNPLYEETPFPTGCTDYDYLKKYYEEQFDHRLKLGIKIASYIALGLGKDRDFFTPWFERDSLSTYRSIYYKPRELSTVKSDQLGMESLALTTPAHSDSGFLTILTTFGFPGLQVLHEGEFRSVKPMPNHMIVNLGDTLSRATNFKLKATKHRVLDIGVERYSQPFFLDPNYSAVIPSNLLLPEEEQTEPPVVFGEWLIKKMTTHYAEWKNFKVDSKKEEPEPEQPEQPEQD